MKTNSVIDAIGNTPLIKLKYPSEITGCEIYGKAEFLNPGSSIKDRAAKGIILDALEKKQLLPGGIIVEGTAGNTGIGLGLVGNSLGYKTLIVMPETQSQEKKDALKKEYILFFGTIILPIRIAKLIRAQQCSFLSRK